MSILSDCQFTYYLPPQGMIMTSPDSSTSPTVLQKELLEARNDLARLQVIDSLRDVKAAAEINGRNDIEVQAAELIQDAERAIAKTIPSQSPQVVDAAESVFSSASLRQMRRVHAISDEEYEQIKAEHRERGEPISRRSLLGVYISDGSLQGTGYGRYRTERQDEELRIQQFGNHLGNVFYHLENETTIAHENWYIYTELALHRERGELMGCISPSFFGIVLKSLLESVILYIARSTDPAQTGKHENVTLVQFSEYLPDPAKSNVIPYVDEVKSLAEPIRIQRNKMYAHLDLDAVLTRRPYVLPGVSLSLIEKVLDLIAESLNEIERQVTSQNLNSEWVRHDTKMAPEQVFTYLLEGWDHLTRPPSQNEA